MDNCEPLAIRLDRWVNGLDAWPDESIPVTEHELLEFIDYFEESKRPTTIEWCKHLIRKQGVFYKKRKIVLI